MSAIILCQVIQYVDRLSEIHQAGDVPVLTLINQLGHTVRTSYFIKINKPPYKGMYINRHRVPVATPHSHPLLNYSHCHSWASLTFLSNLVYIHARRIYHSRDLTLAGGCFFFPSFRFFLSLAAISSFVLFKQCLDKTDQSGHYIVGQ